MSGHSKWANIKHQKQVNDLVRGNLFAKLSRLITLAVVEGGGIEEPENNVKLRLAIEKARDSNMPNENIKRAIDKGTGPNKIQIKEVIYEAFAPPNGSILLIIIATTDNSNRTTSEIRNILEKYNAKLGNQGSVLYLFHKCGLIVFNKSVVNEDNIFILSDSFKALDIDQDATHYYMYIPFEYMGRIKEITNNIPYVSAELDFKPQSVVPVSGENESKKLLELIEALEAHDDIHKVFGNFDIPDEYLK